ncbi:MAG: hypothetical protein LBL59_04025 [Xanthomonadaceae bacterium]|jgi:hypothetical protein|nr:hypothetical protein [Xanthomonadaceae bacterium]
MNGSFGWRHALRAFMLCATGMVLAFAVMADEVRPVETPLDFFARVTVLGEDGIPGAMREMTWREITFAQYSRHTRDYRHRIDPDPARIRVDPSGRYFSFPIRKGWAVYPRERPIFEYDEETDQMYSFDEEGNRVHGDYVCRTRRAAEYVGYIEALSLYVLNALNHSNECLTFVDLYLIDARNDRLWSVPSYNSDGGMSGPVVSPGNRYLAVYQADPLSDPLIEVIQIQKDGDEYSYREYAYFWLRNDRREIRDLVWIDDMRLAVKITREPEADSGKEAGFSCLELRLPAEQAGERQSDAPVSRRPE